MLSLMAAPQPNFQVMPSTLKLTAVSSAAPPWFVELVELPAGSAVVSEPDAAGVSVGAGAGAASGSPQPVLSSAIVESNATASKLSVFIVFFHKIFKDANSQLRDRYD
jgi:hypothetical protein